MRSTAHPFKPVRVAHIGHHMSAECTEEGCPWASPESPNTLEDLKRHVARTGHIVQTLQRVVSRYAGDAQ